jgi:hypothetical protein
MKFRSLRLVTAVFSMAASVLVAGCTSAQGAYENYKDKKELAYVQNAKQSCTRFGFKVDTDAFAQCVNTNANAAKDRDALVEAAFHADKK